ncbi:MAG: uracil-DNA glycosylase [Phycisphaerae bacterium]|nr:uracil-DNA glycosylase [Phycisphaerae bacterium]
MEEKRDLRKIFDQHIELTDFFTGFTVKPAKSVSASQPQENQADKAELLAEVARQVKECQKCVLGGTRTNSVPGEGSPDARLVFVGEGPGENEDLQGRPFVGRAGQLLDKIIAAMGLKRGDVYICNIVKCRPPENREPRPDEIISCLPFLKSQLSIIRPEVIVALGAPAAKTLLNTNKPIGQLRGKFHDFYFDENAEPVKLMPTYHPAYLLRNYSDDNRRKVWEDMQAVIAELGLEVPK